MDDLRERATPTATRVEESTAAEVNQRIRQQTEANLARAAADPIRTEERLRQLDGEWDIERVLQTNFAMVTMLGVTFGAVLARRWFLLPALAAGFMLQHALKGWCPPVPVFRRLGVRTNREIDRERYALKAWRGDFQGVNSQTPFQAYQAARPTDRT